MTWGKAKKVGNLLKQRKPFNNKQNNIFHENTQVGNCVLESQKEFEISKKAETMTAMMCGKAKGVNISNNARSVLTIIKINNLGEIYYLEGTVLKTRTCGHLQKYTKCDLKVIWKSKKCRNFQKKHLM